MPFTLKKKRTVHSEGK